MKLELWLKETVKKLESANPDIRDEGIEDLYNLVSDGVEPDQVPTAIRCATASYPEVDDDWLDVGTALIEACVDIAGVESEPLIAEAYGKLSERARPAALNLLITMEEKVCAERVVSLLKEHGWPKDADNSIRTLYGEPRFPEVYFPFLLDSLIEHGHVLTAVRVGVTYSVHDGLVSEHISKHCDRIMEEYAKLKGVLQEKQQDKPGRWRWEDDYCCVMLDAVAILELMGYMDSPASLEELRSALDFVDCRIQYISIASLVQRGEDVDEKYIRSVAASPDTRCALYALLHGTGRESLMPAEYATQESLAESDLVQWLSYPTELGCEPDEIELVEVLPEKIVSNDGEAEGETYVFRFRVDEPHQHAPNGWMAGAAGPFAKDGGVQFSAEGTFSYLDPWEDMTAAQQLELLRSLSDVDGDCCCGEEDNC